MPAEVQVGRSDGWLLKTESGLQVCYGKGPRKRGPFLYRRSAYPVRPFPDRDGPIGRTTAPLNGSDRQTSGWRTARLPSRARPVPLALPGAGCEHVFALIVCVLIPRFELAVAAGGREALAAGPVALAPEAGREQLDRRGVRGRRGLRRARRPAAGGGAGALPGAAARRARPGRGRRRVGPPARARWRGSARRSSPAAPASPSSTPAACATLHGGSVEGVIAAARRALATPARIGAGAVALRRARRRQPRPRAPRRRSRPPAAPRWRPTSRRCRSRLLAARPGDRGAARAARALRDPHARRAGRAAARRAGRPLRRRRAAAPATSRAGATRRCARAAPAERLEERLELPESASGPQLERALGLLIDRLLARRERRGRTLRAVVLSAELVEGGTWRERADLPRGARRPPAHAARAGAAAGRACPRRPTRCACAPRASARRPATSARCSPSRPPSAPRGCARPSARPARSPGRTPRCASSPSIPDSRVPERRLALTPVGAVSAPAPPVRAAPRARARRPATAGPRRSTAARSRRCASPGWSRTAGGPPTPLRRRYWEVVTAGGRDLVVFRDLEGGRWYAQR